MSSYWNSPNSSWEAESFPSPSAAIFTPVWIYAQFQASCKFQSLSQGIPSAFQLAGINLNKQQVSFSTVSLWAQSLFCLGFEAHSLEKSVLRTKCEDGVRCHGGKANITPQKRILIKPGDTGHTFSCRELHQVMGTGYLWQGGTSSKLRMMLWGPS